MNQDLLQALRLILDHVDYTKQNCSPTDMVSAVLPIQVIESAHQAIAEYRKLTGK